MATRPADYSAPIIERRYAAAFILVTTLFFSWALAAALNDVLIRQFQKALDLSRTESSLIQFAFYIGYFCAAIPAGLLIRRVGYKRTILVGLGCYAVGAFLFYPAAEVREFGLFLTALYVIAIGLAFLETAANPYVTILGAPETASTPDMHEQGKILDALAVLVDEGKIRTTLTERLSPINAANLKTVHALIESGAAKGKTVLEGF